METKQTYSMFIKGIWSSTALWLPVRATNAIKPYAYDTREEAERMLNLCYPDQAVGIDVKVDLTSKGKHKP